MIKILIYLFILLYFGIVEGNEVEEMSKEELVKFLEKKPKLWEHNFLLNSTNRFRYPSGDKIYHQSIYPNLTLIQEHSKYYTYDESESVPREFDSREKWPYCKSSIGLVRDQGSCWSCWAVSMAAVASDRLCIQTEGRVKTQLSAIDIVTCCPECGVGSKIGGCSSGEPYKAWQHFRDKGVVSGSMYSEWSGCRPYSIKPCGPSSSNGYKNLCSNRPPETPSCKRYCREEHVRGYSKDKYYGKEIYYPRTEKAMQLEIMKRGPIQVIFDIYEDFHYYKSGVYYHSWGKYVASHVVKVFGWGIEKGVPYWLGVNTWNYGWGINGIFMFARGINMCGIERWPVTGSVDISNLPSSGSSSYYSKKSKRRSRGG